MIKDQRCIWKAEDRDKLIYSTSKENATSKRTVTRYYWSYLAQGEYGLLSEVKKPDFAKTVEQTCLGFAFLPDVHSAKQERDSTWIYKCIGPWYNAKKQGGH